MPDSPSLSSRTAIVTGASSGIGRAIAEKLARAGANVVLAGRTRGSMDEAQKRIREAGGQASVVGLDVRDPRQVQELVEGALRDTGRVDIMVNNAGVSYPAPIADADVEHWRAMLETNVLGLLVGSQAAVRAMRACKAEGHIVNISSIAAQRRDSGVYGATKHAVDCISATLRTELENDTIRVVNVMPGAIATNFARNFDPGLRAGVRQGHGARDRGEARRAAARRGVREAPRRAEAAARRPRRTSPNAVLFAITQPIHVNIADIVVRPAKQLAL